MIPEDSIAGRRRLSFSFQPHPTCWTIGTPWTESRHVCKVYPKWLGPLTWTSLHLTEKCFTCTWKTPVVRALETRLCPLEWSLGCWLHLPPFSAYLHLDFTSLYWGNFVWISSNLGIKYWKSVIVIDVFLGYFKHYCISVSIPLNDTGRYRKGRACQLRGDAKKPQQCDDQGKISRSVWTEIRHVCQVYQVTWTPLLGLHSLEWKTTDLHFKNWSEESLVGMWCTPKLGSNFKSFFHKWWSKKVSLKG